MTDKPERCRIEWCNHLPTAPHSYGDGETYWSCRSGHVTPQPPPPDLAAIDMADADD